MHKPWDDASERVSAGLLLAFAQEASLKGMSRVDRAVRSQHGEERGREILLLQLNGAESPSFIKRDSRQLLGTPVEESFAALASLSSRQQEQKRRAVLENEVRQQLGGLGFDSAAGKVADSLQWIRWVQAQPIGNEHDKYIARLTGTFAAWEALHQVAPQAMATMLDERIPVAEKYRRFEDMAGNVNQAMQRLGFSDFAEVMATDSVQKNPKGNHMLDMRKEAIAFAHRNHLVTAEDGLVVSSDWRTVQSSLRMLLEAKPGQDIRSLTWNAPQGQAQMHGIGMTPRHEEAHPPGYSFVGAVALSNTTLDRTLQATAKWSLDGAKTSYSPDNYAGLRGDTWVYDKVEGRRARSDGLHMLNEFRKDFKDAPEISVFVAVYANDKNPADRHFRVYSSGYDMFADKYVINAEPPREALDNRMFRGIFAVPMEEQITPTLGKSR